MKQTGKKRDTDSHIKPLRGSRFPGWVSLRTAPGSWRKSGQGKWLEIGALWWAAGVHKADTQSEMELNWGWGAFQQSLLYMQGPQIFIPW